MLGLARHPPARLHLLSKPRVPAALSRDPRGLGAAPRRKRRGTGGRGRGSHLAPLGRLVGD